MIGSLIVQYIKQIKRTEWSASMLQKRTSNRECFSNYSQSFSNLHHPSLPIDIREFWLRKSLFDPPQGLAESFAARRHIPGADVPVVDVVHSTARWLLLQAPRFSRSFFRHLNAGRFGNPYQQLQRLFKNFTALTRVYGYFRPTAGMIFTDRREVKVWISEDIFTNDALMPLDQGFKGERDFVVAFLAMVEAEMREWERVSNVFTIDDAHRLLEWRSKLNRGSTTAIDASKEVFCRQNESIASFQANELGCYGQKLKACRSVQEFECGVGLDYFQTDMSNSVTIKESERRNMPNSSTDEQMFQQMCESKDLKHSAFDSKPIEGSTEVRRTKKKFNLTSTSSTLERFSEKWRSTVGKKNQKQLQRPQSHSRKEQPPQTPHPHPPEHTSIQNELQGLFSDEGVRELKLGIEGDREELEKIAEEMEEVLIW